LAVDRVGDLPEGSQIRDQRRRALDPGDAPLGVPGPDRPGARRPGHRRRARPPGGPRTRPGPAWPADASTWTETGTATARPRSGRASRPAARASPSSPRQPRSASAALSPPDPQPPAVPLPRSHRRTRPPGDPAAARSDIRAAATPSLSVSNPGQPAPASAATTAMPDHVELHGIAVKVVARARQTLIWERTRRVCQISGVRAFLVSFFVHSKMDLRPRTYCDLFR